MNKSEYNLLMAAFMFIEHRLELVHWNAGDEDFASPFGNNGTEFICPVFEVRSYDWAWDFSDSDEPQPVNFKWRDISITWYKYSGRGMEIVSGSVTPENISLMLDECIEWISDNMNTDY